MSNKYQTQFLKLSEETQEQLKIIENYEEEIEKKKKEIEKLEILEANANQKIHKKYKIAGKDIEILSKIQNLHQMYLARSGSWVCACKIIKFDQISRENYQNLSILEEIEHRNILPIFLVKQNRKMDIEIYTEYPSISLSDFILEIRDKYANTTNNLPHSTILSVSLITSFALQIANALNYLHENQIGSFPFLFPPFPSSFHFPTLPLNYFFMQNSLFPPLTSLSFFLFFLPVLFVLQHSFCALLFLFLLPLVVF